MIDDIVQAPPLAVTIDVEPTASTSALAYAPLAPKTAQDNPRFMIALTLRITNTGQTLLTFKDLQFSFAGPPFVFTNAYTRDDVSGDDTIAPGTSSSIKFSRNVSIVVDDPAPGAVSLKVRFEESTETVTVFRQLVQHLNPVNKGSYRLPFRAADLPTKGFISGTSGHGGTNQRFAYDMGTAQWDSEQMQWRGLKPGTTENTNENQVGWEMPVYAMADGEVIEFENDNADNPAPPVTNGLSSNKIVIRHGTERASYLHLRQGSLNPELLVEGSSVSEGQFLGRMGNSGSSSQVHLHIQVVDDVTGFARPLLFRNGWIVDRSTVDPVDLSAQWVKLDGQALPFEKTNIWPNDLLPRIISRLGDVQHLPTERFRVVAVNARTFMVAFADTDERLLLVAIGVSIDGTSMEILGNSGNLAGTVGLINMVSIGFDRVATAVTTESGRLKLIIWRFLNNGTSIERLGDSGDQAGSTSAISLISLGAEHLVTSLRSNEGREKVILWRVSSDGNAVQRISDGGNTGPETDRVAIVPAGLGRFATVGRDNEQRLFIEVWEASPTGNPITQVSDSANQAGIVNEVHALSLGRSQLVTAVSTQDERLKLIVWNIDDQGQISRIGDSGLQAGLVQQISIASPEPEIVVSSVTDSDGNLKLIAWHIAQNGVMTRLGDSGNQAGQSTMVDVSALAPNRVVVGARSNSGSLKLIAWSLRSTATST